MRNALEKHLLQTFKWYKPSLHMPWWRILCMNMRVTQSSVRYVGTYFSGFYVGDGWFDLLWELSKKIDKHLESNPELKQYFTVADVKEKFGGLRFYFYGGDSVIKKYVEEAEELSYTICEICGKPGRPNKTGWITTLCSTCRKKRR